MYYHENNFNGVLILMREPHVSEKDKGQSGEEIERKSDEWITNALKGTSLEREAVAYHDCFQELLQCIKPGESLSRIAYTNLYKKGGGGTKSQEYINCRKMYSKSQFDELIREFGDKLECIFTCNDIFNRLKSKEVLYRDIALCPECGFSYSYQRQRQTKVTKKRAMKYGNIMIYEIMHPSNWTHTLIPKKL